jgi:hypothetical protein
VKERWFADRLDFLAVFLAFVVCMALVFRGASCAETVEKYRAEGACCGREGPS